MCRKIEAPRCESGERLEAYPTLRRGVMTGGGCCGHAPQNAYFYLWLERAAAQSIERADGYRIGVDY
jgi:hypothetical protein